MLLLLLFFCFALLDGTNLDSSYDDDSDNEDDVASDNQQLEQVS